MRRRALTVSVIAAIAAPSAAAARGVPTCVVPTGELVVYRHGGALVTGNAVVSKSTRVVNYYGCLRGVGRLILIDRGGSGVGPQNFTIAGNYLAFVQVNNSGATTVSKMAIEQWNLATGKRTLNPNSVRGVTYETASAPPKLTESTRGYLAWSITTGPAFDPNNPGPVDTLTNLMAFNGHAASVADSFNSQTDAAPPGTIISLIFTDVAITGKVLSWKRLGAPKSAPIG